MRDLPKSTKIVFQCGDAHCFEDLFLSFNACMEEPTRTPCGMCWIYSGRCSMIRACKENIPLPCCVWWPFLVLKSTICSLNLPFHSPFRWQHTPKNWILIAWNMRSIDLLRRSFCVFPKVSVFFALQANPRNGRVLRKVSPDLPCFNVLLSSCALGIWEDSGSGRAKKQWWNNRWNNPGRRMMEAE